MAKSKLTWIPIKRGDVFCSSACGAGCKLAQYEAAKAAARACKRRMKEPKDWNIHVQENMGWYWKLIHSSGVLTVSGGQLPYSDNPGRNFHAMLSSSGHAGTCDALWYDEQRFNDPNKAVEHRLALALRHLQKVNALLEQFDIGVKV